MRVVLDTNVVVSGYLWGGVPRQLLQAARQNRLRLFTSTPLLLELADILGRVKFTRKLAAAQLSIDQLVDGYALLATVVHPVAINPTIIIDDPDDDQVLACALSAKTDIIVSGDRHLLDLQKHQGIRIVTSAEAMDVVANLSR